MDLLWIDSCLLVLTRRGDQTGADDVEQASTAGSEMNSAADALSSNGTREIGGILGGNGPTSQVSPHYGHGSVSAPFTPCHVFISTLPFLLLL